MALEQDKYIQDERAFESRLRFSQLLIGLNQEKIALVQVSWEAVTEHMVLCASLFSANICLADPSLERLFERNRTERSLELIRVVSFIVGELEQVVDLVPYLKSLGQLLRQNGVQESCQQTVGQALFQTLQQWLGQRFTPAVQNAWAIAFGFVTKIMIEASKP
jgi:hemoglobin-like flavoprotein